MSLRAKLLSLFIALGIVPLIGVGIVGYVQSLGALESLLTRQTTAVVRDAVRALEQRFARLDSDILFFGGNAETQAMYASLSGNASDGQAVSARRVDAFLREAWAQLGKGYESLELRDANNRVLYRLAGSGPGAFGIEGRVRSIPIVREIRDEVTGQRRGTISLSVPLDAFLPRDMLERHVGEQGFSIVVDRASGAVIFDARPDIGPQSMKEVALRELWPKHVTISAGSPGSFVAGRGQSARVTSYASLTSPPWTILATAAVGEIALPFVEARTTQLFLVLAVTGLVAVSFVFLLRRTTRSLEELTLTADEVGRGNFAGRNPAIGVERLDEVGRLGHAFDVMVTRIREMISQIEVSRQMAVLGEFASQIAHEIRNPLTAIKLNLQGLARDARSGAIPPASAEAVGIALGEINRLDGVVSGVLELAQSGVVRREPCGIRMIVSEAVRLVREQAAAAGIELTVELIDADATVLADSAQLQGAILNLLLNAIATTPAGERITVTMYNVDGEESRRIRVSVFDTGPGVAAADRERIFRPFVTTRHDGTGLGLPVARRVVEAHGGRLFLAHRDTGAEFIIELPTQVTA